VTYGEKGTEAHRTSKASRSARGKGDNQRGVRVSPAYYEIVLKVCQRVLLKKQEEKAESLSFRSIGSRRGINGGVIGRKKET